MSKQATPDVAILAENQRIIAMLQAVVRTIEPIVPGTAEVVLHEIAKLPESIVAVAGNVTGRSVGDPATDVLLEAVASGTSQDFLQGYSTVLPDGHNLTSSTTILRNSLGDPVAALCVNADFGAWERLRHLVSAMGGGAPMMPPVGTSLSEGSSERFAHDVDELAAHLIADTIQRIGVPVSLMRKEHKVAVVARLRERGMFLLKDAVETVATSLEVTRFTIYNYLNELDAEEAANSTE
jgi:predicted transcriptional regulator YheO